MSTRNEKAIPARYDGFLTVAGWDGDDDLRFSAADAAGETEVYLTRSSARELFVWLGQRLHEPTVS